MTLYKSTCYRADRLIKKTKKSEKIISMSKRKCTVTLMVLMLLIGICLYLAFSQKSTRTTESIQTSNIQDSSTAFSESGDAPTIFAEPDIVEDAKKNPDISPTVEAKENSSNLDKYIRQGLKELLDEQLPLNEQRFLPFETLTQKDIAVTFAPHYTESVSKILTEEMQKDLELIVFHRLRWMLEANLESFRSNTVRLSKLLQKPLDPNNIRQKYAQEAYSKFPYSPYYRMGFADVPFKVEQIDKLPNPGANPVIKELSEKAGKDAILVTVFTAAKIAPNERPIKPYIKIKTMFCYDRDSLIFHYVRTNFELTEHPATDIPLFFQGID